MWSMCAWASIVDQIQAKNLRKIEAGEDYEEQDALKKTTLPKEGDIAEIYGLKKKAAGF